MKELKLMYSVPIKEKGLIDGDFIINGTAINATTTSNNHQFIGEELQKSAATLKGVPLLIDHRNEVSAIKGRVISGQYIEESERIDFNAKVSDNEIKELIKRGDLNTVSVGAVVEDIEEGENGVLIPKGITFKELSLVAIPADAGATFNVALKEAFNGFTEKTDSHLIVQKEVKMAEETHEEVSEPAEVEEPKEVEPETEETESNEEVSEMLKILKSMDKRLKKLEEADADEEPKETPEPTPEPEVEETEEEDEEEDEDFDEGFKFAESHGSIRGGSLTVIR